MPGDEGRRVEGRTEPSRELSPSRRVLFSFVVAALVVILLELLLQGVYFLTASEFLFNRIGIGLFVEDDLRCYRMQSDLEHVSRSSEYDFTIYTNGQGRRTDARRLEIPFERTQGTLRVVFLGPSFTFGWGADYEEIYPSLIAEGLEAALGQPVEVLNLGTPAQGPVPQLCWFLAEGYRYQPDLVVLTTYGDPTSVGGACPEELRCPLVRDGLLYFKEPTFARTAVARLKESALVYYGFLAYTVLRGAVDDGGGIGRGKELYSERERRAIANDPKLVADFERYVAAVHGAAGPQVEVAFLHIPFSFAVHEEDVPRWRHVMEADPVRARARVRGGMDALRGRGLTVIDPLDALLEAREQERLYYWLDIHLTAAGNRVVADAALPVLTRLLRAEGH